MKTRDLVSCAVVLALIPVGQAGAATLTTDAKCYVAGSTIVASGTGFGPGNSVFLEGPQMFASTPADGAGSLFAPLRAPNLGAFIQPGFKTFTVTATDQTTRDTAAATFKVANLTFATNGGVQAPRRKRTWRFSGFIQRPGKPIYGHFRHGGRTYANYRFGVPKGPCGTLRKRAPGIPAKRRVKTGKWLVQVDYKRTYSRRTSPRVTSTTVVFRTVR